MLDEQGARMLRAVQDLVGLLLLVHELLNDGALEYLHLAQLFCILELRVDFGAEVDGIRNQPFIVRLKIGDLGIARVR